MVTMSPEIRRKAYFWLVLLKSTTGLAAIPTVVQPAARTREYFTDASGGSPLMNGPVTGPKINSGARRANG
jgi:hypothetical protein